MQLGHFSTFSLNYCIPAEQSQIFKSCVWNNSKIKAFPGKEVIGCMKGGQVSVIVH